MSPDHLIIFIEGFKERWIFGPVIIKSFNFDHKNFIRETKRF